MTVNELLTRAQYLAGMNDVMGLAVDANFLAFAYEVFSQTLMDLNNDNRLAILVARHDYQKDEFEHEEDGDGIGQASLWGPFPAMGEYPLPPDCSRVLRAFSGPVELRKTDFSSIVQFVSYTGFANRFAVNGRSITLAGAKPLVITYVPKIKIPGMGDDIGIGDEFLPYLVNKTAFKLALAQSLPSVGRCNTAASESWDVLMSNKRTNNGDVYQSIYSSLNRFNPIGMGL